MKPRYEVFLTADAERDLENLFREIAKRDSLEEARRFLVRFESVVNDLSSSPQRSGSFPDELKTLRIRKYRVTCLKPYRVFHGVRGQEVFIYLISDGRNSIGNRLACRLRPPLPHKPATAKPIAIPAATSCSTRENSNRVMTDGFSNPEARRLYLCKWPQEPQVSKMYAEGRQCGGCSFYAKLNADYGLCSHESSRHHLETVFEHFTCPAHVDEGWGAHSFSTDQDDHCRCRSSTG